MELRHLRTFLAVAEELHFGAAAERLFLSAPAVTVHIRALERELGVCLFVRGRTVELTDAGTALLTHARDTLAQVDATLAAVRAYADGRSGHLRIGVLSNGAGVLTPTIIQAYMAAHPAVRVGIFRLNFHDYLQAVHDHRVDVAFVRPEPDDERLSVLRLVAEPRIAVVPAYHPMAGADRVAADAMLEEPFVSLADGVPSTFADYLHLRSLRGGLRPRTVDTGCEDVTDVLAAVAAGRGVASAVESFRGYENWPGVAYLKIDGAETAFNVVISRHGDPSPVVRSFLTTVEMLSG
ncbi:MAG: LysR substrate-binding domain-containing protein [Acidimicrobiales bacterium]